MHGACCWPMRTTQRGAGMMNRLRPAEGALARRGGRGASGLFSTARRRPCSVSPSRTSAGGCGRSGWFLLPCGVGGGSAVGSSAGAGSGPKRSGSWGRKIIQRCASSSWGVIISPPPAGLALRSFSACRGSSVGPPLGDPSHAPQWQLVDRGGNRTERAQPAVPAAANCQGHDAGGSNHRLGHCPQCRRQSGGVALHDW
jgi:hypothetical protein